MMPVIGKLNTKEVIILSFHKTGKSFKDLLTEVLNRYKSELDASDAEATFGADYVAYEKSLIDDLLSAPEVGR